MSDIYANSRSTTDTSVRKRDVNPTSGMCPICIKDCKVLCEVGKSALRGREVLYPDTEQFGHSTASSNKDYGLDWSDFQILTDCIGAKGIAPNPDAATFPAVDIRTVAGGVPLSVPVFTAGLGSTAVAKNYWDGLAVGAAISGSMQVIGENVCGMDMDSVITGGKVTHSPDLTFRVQRFRDFWDGKNGEIVVQTNVEDQRLGTDVYALSKLEVNIIERKWGQGAKAIGGEVRIYDLNKALELKRRGYIVLPDPEDPAVQKAFKEGAFKTFERHSRVGFPEFKGFVEDIEWLRNQGAKKVFLKTGAYRPVTTAFALKCASAAKIDLLTFDGAGGGTGMSPVPMMNDCSTPTVYLQAQVMDCVKIMKENGMYVPDIAFAGGFVNETQMFKSMAMSDLGSGPTVKAIAMARPPITAVMKAQYFSELAQKNDLPGQFTRAYSTDPEKFMIAYSDLVAKYGNDAKNIPIGAIGLYTYWHDRLGVGLQQLMAGSRKFKLKYISRGDIASLTERAAAVTGIPMISELENDLMAKILLE
ncbi:FMN-binding glutamate synthase family protein [Methanocella sp. CWC-04]|uniref:FMN-binding glutamate synthase family protein n=1 Tax=Methanooceanicella nereidis TaxID=2052831 RepID=A0AAP2W653_9EURY|nr:FMN-binding glutamate synthase family protein [Methanocella sp. CWC-04]MCD1293909.1 FMN-binding glutamate synthase family protein [Methanocella sp. CWC-04]